LLASAAPAGMQVRDLQASSPLRQIAGGFLCNAFNPKAPIYFLALRCCLRSCRADPAELRSMDHAAAPPWWRSVCACWQLRAIESD